MKIVTISWVRNEGDILEAFVRHNATFADRMVVVDHRSQDGSRKILEALKNEGLPLEVRTNDGFAHVQPEVLTRVMREVAKREDPDWIFALDSDEFLVSTALKPLREAIQEEPNDQVLRIPSRGYVPTPGDLIEPHLLKRIRYRRRKERPQWWKAALPRAVLTDFSDLNLGYGSHGVSRGQRGFLQMQTSKGLALAHFPIRSSAQVARKAVGGWLSFRLFSDQWQSRGSTFQWKAIYDRLQKKRDYSPEELMQLGLTYATTDQWDSLPCEFTQGDLKEIYPSTESADYEKNEDLIFDPVATDGVLRFEARDIGAWPILLSAASDLADEYVKLARLSGEE